ncbi:hypothetical protein ACFLU3_03515 [Chloroflexota bacterium]
MKNRWCCEDWDVTNGGRRISGFYRCGGWWRRDRLDSIRSGLIFIWAAIVLLASLTDFAGIDWNSWSVFFIGAGTIVLGVTVIRHVVPEYRRRGRIFGWIFGFVLLSIGLGDAMIWIWVPVLAVIGFSILKGLSRK